MNLNFGISYYLLVGLSPPSSPRAELKGMGLIRHVAGLGGMCVGKACCYSATSKMRWYKEGLTAAAWYQLCMIC